MNKFPKESSVKDWCENIKGYVGKYIVVKTSSGNLHEGWFDECIEDPSDPDDIILRISVENGVLLIRRFSIIFIFEAVYGYDDDYVSSPEEYKMRLTKLERENK